MHNQEGGAVRDLLRESDDGLRVVADDERALFHSGGKFACDGLQGQYHEDMIRYLDVDTAGTCGKCISVCPLAYIE